MPAQRFDCDFEVFLKSNGIQDVPTIQVEALLRLKNAVCLGGTRHARIGRTEFLITIGSRDLKSISAAKIILSSSSTNGGELCIIIEEKPDFSLAPPIVVVATPDHGCADILSPPFDSIHDDVIRFAGFQQKGII